MLSYTIFYVILFYFCLHLPEPDTPKIVTKLPGANLGEGSILAFSAIFLFLSTNGLVSKFRRRFHFSIFHHFLVLVHKWFSFQMAQFLKVTKFILFIFCPLLCSSPFSILFFNSALPPPILLLRVILIQNTLHTPYTLSHCTLPLLSLLIFIIHFYKVYSQYNWSVRQL